MASLTRRMFFATAAAGFIRPALAQLHPGSFRVGVLYGGSPVPPWTAAMVDKLAELGYADGQNLHLEPRTANGEVDRLPTLAAELIALRPDVIVATTTPSMMALFRAHCTIPVVFISGIDPIKLGVVESVPHPGGNYTGVINISSELTGKRLEFLRDLLPEARRVVCFTNPAFNPAATAVFLKQTIADASRLGLDFALIEVPSADQLAQAFDKAAEQKAEALLGVPDALLFSNRQRIIALARERKLPAIYNFRIEAAEGGLMAYGADVEAQFRTVAIYVDKILRGDKPGELPIDQATKPALVINLKTAKELGLEIPAVLLAQADDVIE